MRRPLVVANWKMHKVGAEVRAFAEALASSWPFGLDVELAICPPFPYISLLREELSARGLSVGLGAQDAFFEDLGPFTGEVSPLMLSDLGCLYCIVGHSERRSLFGEGDELVGRKLRALLRRGIRPILCVGERLEERRAGRSEEVVLSQLRGALEGVDPSSGGDLVLAYEPVWAIGTGVNASPEQAQEMARLIREELSSLLGPVGEGVRVLYGGSVSPENAAGFASLPDVDGALVGGASLDPGKFLAIASCFGS